MTQLDLLVAAVRASAIPAGQIAADNPSIDLASFLTLVADLKAGRLVIEQGQVVRDYTQMATKGRQGR